MRRLQHTMGRRREAKSSVAKATSGRFLGLPGHRCPQGLDTPPGLQCRFLSQFRALTCCLTLVQSHPHGRLAIRLTAADLGQRRRHYGVQACYLSAAVHTIRKPRLGFRPFGGHWPRSDERIRPGLTSQPPPRVVCSEPASGPIGSTGGESL